MQNLQSVYIGIVDILGYKNAEACADGYGGTSSIALLKNIYDNLDSHIQGFNDNDKEVRWVRYGDGYVFYSKSSEINNLISMINNAIRLIALSLVSSSVPLRVAITQGDIKVDEPQFGLTVTGSGWNNLMEIEKCLNWMGGWLYLPSCDGSHAQVINELTASGHLIVQQSTCEDDCAKFVAPFKGNNKFPEDKSWFINWTKLLRMQNDQTDRFIRNWWQQILMRDINTSEEVKVKQENTKCFAHYCNALYKSARLVHFSKVQPIKMMD